MAPAFNAEFRRHFYEYRTKANGAILFFRKFSGMGILGLTWAYAGPLCDPYAVIKWYVINDIKDSISKRCLLTYF